MYILLTMQCIQSFINSNLYKIKEENKLKSHTRYTIYYENVKKLIKNYKSIYEPSFLLFFCAIVARNNKKEADPIFAYRSFYFS